MKRLHRHAACRAENADRYGPHPGRKKASVSGGLKLVVLGGYIHAATAAGGIFAVRTSDLARRRERTAKRTRLM